MKTIIQAIDFKARKTLTDFVEESMVKLEPFSDRIVDSKVTLRLNKSDQKENKICEIRLTIPGRDFFSSKASETFEDAVLKAIDAIKHQMVRTKDEKIHNVNRSTVSFESEDEI